MERGGESYKDQFTNESFPLAPRDEHRHHITPGTRRGENIVHIKEVGTTAA